MATTLEHPINSMQQERVLIVHSLIAVEDATEG